jgi:hypothetical protein
MIGIALKHFHNLNTKGFAHWVIPAFAIVVIGGIGTYMLTASHADSCSSTSSANACEHLMSQSWHTIKSISENWSSAKSTNPNVTSGKTFSNATQNLTAGLKYKWCATLKTAASTGGSGNRQFNLQTVETLANTPYGGLNPGTYTLCTGTIKPAKKITSEYPKIYVAGIPLTVTHIYWQRYY